MDNSRSTISNIVCIIFSVVLAVLFCFTVGIRFRIDNIVSRAIIAAIHCGFIVGLAFVLDKIIKKVFINGIKVDYDKTFIGVSIVDFILFIVLRLLVIGGIINTEFLKSSVYETAKIAEGNRVFLDFTNVNNAFASILSLSFKLMGNTFIAIYLIQFIFSFLSFVLIFLSVKSIFNRFVACSVSLGVAVIPAFYTTISSDSPDNMLLLIFSLLLFVTSKFKEKIDEDNIKIAYCIVIGILSGVFSVFSSLYLFFIAIPIMIILDCRNESASKRGINIFAIVTSSIFAFAIVLLFDAYIITKNGIEGFADELMRHVLYKFTFHFNLSFLKTFIYENTFFIIMAISIIYCVMYWKNDDDTAHIANVEILLITSQIVGINLNNRNSFILLLLLLFIIVAGSGIYDLLFAESSVRVYKLEDDIPVPIIIKDSKVKEEADKKVVESSIESVTEASIESSNGTVAELSAEISIEQVTESTEEAIPESTINLAEESALESASVSTIEDISNVALKVDNTDSDIVNDNSLSIDRKYTEAEVRKTSDYGINNADFESLFSGGNVPPKFVYNNIFTEDNETVEEVESTDEKISEIDPIEETKEDSSSNIIDDSISDNADSFSINEEENDMDDKKAYVDSFFGYLYNDSKANDSSETEKYVSNASKFADLDLDLGIDAFDNVNIETDAEKVDILTDARIDDTDTVVNVPTEDVSIDVLPAKEILVEEIPTKEILVEEIPTEEISLEEIHAEETPVDDALIERLSTQDVFEEKLSIEDISLNGITVTLDETKSNESFISDEKENNNFFFEEGSYHSEEAVLENFVFAESVSMDNDFEVSTNDAVINETDGGEDETSSIEALLEKKIDDDFSYEEAINNRIDQEEVDSLIGFSFEDAIEKKLQVEDAIEKAKAKDDFSIEEIIQEKLIAEDSMLEAIDNDYVSFEKTAKGKIAIEELISENLSKDDFSYQEAIETKIDVETAIENATNDKLLEEFGSDELFNDINFDFSDNYIENNLDQKNDYVEKNIDSALVDSTNTNESHDNSNDTLIQYDYIQFENNDNSDAVSDIPSSDGEFVRYEKISVEDSSKEETNPLKEEKTAAVEEKTAAVEEGKIEFIENPLPVPKKPKHREMDYGRSIPYAWMHYDIELDKTNDHYDI